MHHIAWKNTDLMSIIKIKVQKKYSIEQLTDKHQAGVLIFLLKESNVK